MAELAFFKTPTTSDLRRADDSMHFWLVHGWVDEPATVRGEDGTIALAHGVKPNPRWKKVRKVTLRGRLKAASLSAMLALQQELLTIFDLTERGSLIVGDEYKGLATGQTATLAGVLPISCNADDSQTEYHRLYTVTLESGANPPEWEFAGP